MAGESVTEFSWAEAIERTATSFLCTTNNHSNHEAFATQILSCVSPEAKELALVRFLLIEAKNVARERVVATERAAERRDRRRMDTTRRAARKEWEATHPEYAQMGTFGYLKHAIDEYETNLRMEWTEQLLASGFALMDGTVVSWGEATIAQHRERMEMFEDQAETAANGIARHSKAIAAIQSSRVSCLNELCAGALANA